MKNKSPLLIKPDVASNVYQTITHQAANWKYLHFEARKIGMNAI